MAAMVAMALTGTAWGLTPASEGVVAAPSETPRGDAQPGLVAGEARASRWAVVRTSDGAVFEGELRDEGLMVIVRDRRGIETRIPRERVASITYREETELEFLRRYRELLRDDVEDRVELARFALSEGRPDLAWRVLVEALEVDPNHREAARLYDVVRGQLELRRRRDEGEPERLPEQREHLGSSQASKPGGAAAEPPAAWPPAVAPSGAGLAVPPVASTGRTSPLPLSGAQTGGAERATTRGARQLLTPEQINRIRQVELRLGETNVPLRFDNDVERRFAARRGVTLASLRQRTPLERFTLMRDAGEADLLADVRVLRDPASLLEYRNRIQPRVLSGCATSGCHGGDAAGEFRLFSPASSEAESYTNFYILATRSYVVRGPDGRTVERRMLDRVSPEQSLLLQFLLPPEVARFPHPGVRGFRAVFRSMEADGFRQFLNWVSQSLTPIDPDYGFEFPARPDTGGEDATGSSREGSGGGQAPAKDGPATQPSRP